MQTEISLKLPQLPLRDKVNSPKLPYFNIPCNKTSMEFQKTASHPKRNFQEISIISIISILISYRFKTKYVYRFEDPIPRMRRIYGNFGNYLEITVFTEISTNSSYSWGRVFKSMYIFSLKPTRY